MRLSTTAVVLALYATPGFAQEPKHAFMTASDGVKIHYVELGEGTPVILIHGYTGNSEGKWLKSGIAQALAERNRVIAMDARGHGQSDKPHDPMKYGPQMAEDVVELMDHLGIQRAHIHGYSMGGSILTQLLARHPERIITAIYGGSGVREVDPEWQARVPEDPEAPDDLPQPPSRENWSAYPGFDRTALAAVREYPWQPEQRAIDLGEVDVPVLAIVGGYDRPNGRTHRMTRELDDFQLVVLPGETHGSAHFNPRYTEVIVEFVQAHPSAQSQGWTDHFHELKDGTVLHYVEQGEGTPVILIHGAGGTAVGNWFRNGIAPALAKTNRVIGIDMRGHGQTESAPGGGLGNMAPDVLELMDHLGIEKAHIGGYSMGGFVTSAILRTNPERFITASFGGSGITETEEWRDKVPPDVEGDAPDEVVARAAYAAAREARGESTAGRGARGAAARGRRGGLGGLGLAARPPIDLTKIDFPVLAINGEYDRPNAKTHRMWRELKNFTNVVLPGKGHLSAVMAQTIPQQYIDSMVAFITSNNPK